MKGPICLKCQKPTKRISGTRSQCEVCGRRYARFPETLADRFWLKQRGNWQVDD